MNCDWWKKNKRKKRKKGNVKSDMIRDENRKLKT